MPLSAAEQTRASMGGCWANAGARAMRFLRDLLAAAKTATLSTIVSEIQQLLGDHQNAVARH
jgi:hypothetical protein